MRRPSFLLAIILLCGALGAAQDAVSKSADPPENEPSKPKGVIHLQEVKEVPKIHADQPCNNFSWAASLAAVLASQNAEIKQDFWVDKYYGGDLCLDEIGAPDNLIRKAEGVYVLDDGRHVQLKLEYFSGLPAHSSALLVPILTDEILILFVDGHADLLVGAMWDEYQSQRGERMIDLKELHLLDPLLEGDKQKVILDATSDEVSRITGYMKVKAVEVDQQYWPK